MSFVCIKKDDRKMGFYCDLDGVDDGEQSRIVVEISAVIT